MGAFELLALSLALSVATAATAWVGGRLVEGRSGDPRLRDRMWGTALVLPVLPPLAVGLMLLIPAPVREIAALPPVVKDPTLFEAVAETTAGTVEPAFLLDLRLLAVTILILAGLLTLARLGRLASRAWRLARLVRTLDRADPATLRLVVTAAGTLGISTPRVGVSAGAPEPLLSGFVRPRLILPAALSATADPAVVRAVIAHELVHLKRGDHRTLWLEEGLLALLAINPLMPVLRARRAAAREEACDALALAGAGLETRRAYAETLIEALRRRAGPQVLPALSFTGAGRRTAMRRLKAVMTPAAPARRAVRLTALGLGFGLLAAVTGMSVAVADQREPTPIQTTPAVSSGNDFAARLQGASAADYQLFCAAPEGTPDRMGCSVLLWDAALAEQSAAAPAFCAANPSGAELNLIAERGRAAVLTRAAGSGSAADAARRAMIAAFPCGAEPRTISAEAVARAGASLGAKWEQAHGEQARAEVEARRVADAAVTGADYQRMCASPDPRDDGFCAGVLFRTTITEARSAAPAFCAPEQGDREATQRFVEGAKAGVAGVRTSVDQTPSDVARAGLMRAYPCNAAAPGFQPA